MSNRTSYPRDGITQEGQCPGAEELRVKTYRRIGERLVAAWEPMERQGGAISPLLSHRYLRNVFRQARRLAWLRGGRPIIRCAEDASGRILAIAPLVEYALPASYRLLGDIRGCGAADLLYAPELDEPQRMRCAAALLDSLGSRWKLRRLPEHSLLARLLAERGHAPVPHDCCRIPLEGDCESWFAGLSSSTRQNIRTACNRLRRDGRTWRLAIAGGGDAATAFDDPLPPIDEELYADGLRVYIDRQQTKYNHAAAVFRSIKRFAYVHVKHDTESLRRNPDALLVMLYVDEEPAAYMGGFVSADRQTIVVPRLAIDARFRFYSPGYVMLNETIRLLKSSSQVRMLDLARGVEKYKLDLGGEIYRTLGFESR